MKKKNYNTVPRGIRNNNPLNIRIGNNWKGEKTPNTDGQFEQFKTMDYGIRAAIILLRRYFKKYKLNTVRGIVSRWAPRTENNTKRYIEFVSDEIGAKPDEKLTFCYTDVCGLVIAMSLMETGIRLDENDFDKGWELYTQEALCCNFSFS